MLAIYIVGSGIYSYKKIVATKLFVIQYKFVYGSLNWPFLGCANWRNPWNSQDSGLWRGWRVCIEGIGAEAGHFQEPYLWNSTFQSSPFWGAGLTLSGHISLNDEWLVLRWKKLVARAFINICSTIYITFPYILSLSNLLGFDGGDWAQELIGASFLFLISWYADTDQVRVDGSHSAWRIWWPSFHSW